MNNSKKSDVYLAQVSSSEPKARTAALEKILKRINLTYDKGEFVPVKLTIGDSACVYNLNPELVKLVVAQVKEKGAKPFLFDWFSGDPRDFMGVEKALRKEYRSALQKRGLIQKEESV